MPYDVVIAGGGPVGLFLACELRLAGVSVLVLERRQDPHSPLKAGWMGMRGLNVPSIEALNRRGLLDAVRDASLGWMSAGGRPEIEMGAPEDPKSTPAPRFAATSPESCSTRARLTSLAKSTQFPARRRRAGS